MTPLPRRLRRQIVNAPEPTPPPELAERLASEAVRSLGRLSLDEWGGHSPSDILMPLFREAVRGEG